MISTPTQKRNYLSLCCWPWEDWGFIPYRTQSVWRRFSFLFSFFIFYSHRQTYMFRDQAPRMYGWLTIDCEVHPAAVVEGVVLLLQHQDPALVPALVLGAYWVNLQGGLPMQRGSTWRHRKKKRPELTFSSNGSSSPFKRTHQLRWSP